MFLFPPFLNDAVAPVQIELRERRSDPQQKKSKARRFDVAIKYCSPPSKRIKDVLVAYAKYVPPLFPSFAGHPLCGWVAVRSGCKMHLLLTTLQLERKKDL